MGGCDRTVATVRPAGDVMHRATSRRPSTSSRKRRVVAALMWLTTCCGVLVVAASAQAVGTGSISGTVTKYQGGEPVAYAEVCAGPASGSPLFDECHGSFFGAGTNSDGQYTISGLAPGQ